MRRDLEQDERGQVLAAKHQLRQLHEPAAVPALLDVLAEEAPTDEATITRRIHLLAALGNIDDPAAVEALVEFAVESPRKLVRYSAIDQLSAKPYEDFVPVLLSAMRMPVEASCNVYQVGDRIVSDYAYREEGPTEEDYATNYHSYTTIPGARYLSSNTYKHRIVPRQLIRPKSYVPERVVPPMPCGDHIVPGHTVAAHFRPAQYSPARRESVYTGTNYGEHPGYQAQREQTVQQTQDQARSVQDRVAQQNEWNQHYNDRITDVLTRVTDQTLSAFPKSWWNWWSDYLQNHPDIAAQGARQQWNNALLNQDPRGVARGSWVWTRRGRRRIETIMPGDYILSQHPLSGELAYQLVLALTAPQENPVSKVDFSDTALHCAPGHVVWLAGTGWRRLGKVAPGQLLHAVKDEPRLADREQVFSIDCYDLIVDNFHTYFVGQQGVLVHDATPVAPAHVSLPGISPALVAHAQETDIGIP